MSAPVWHLLTGELARGGIGDYTRLLADALADAGREVHVWSPDAAGVTLRSAMVHPMRGVGPAALRELDAALDRFPAPRRLRVQYAPQAWGVRGMNVGFARWLLGRRRAGDDVRVMFHEPFFPFGWQRPQRNLLAAVNRWMARLLLRASAPRAYVSISAWAQLLRPLAPRELELTVLPIPSTIPYVEEPSRVAALRRQLSDGGKRPVFVHFGTYGEMIAPMLLDVLAVLVDRRPDARILLLGENGPAFAARLRSADPRVADAVVAPGRLDAGDVSLHLQASDVALQPYPDGADTRRTSLMACLANGVPTITTRGRFTTADVIQSVAGYPSATEPHRVAGIAASVCEDAGAVLLAAYPDLPLREATRAAYLANFDIRHTVARLLADEGGG
jgi:glycosyltransferase involved in cell wall biosynthesis